MAIEQVRGELDPDPEPVPVPIPEQRLTGYVVVRLDEKVPVGAADDLLDHATANGGQLNQLQEFLIANRRPLSRRAVTSIGIDRLLHLEELAARNLAAHDEPPLPMRLSHLWRIDSRSFAKSPELAVRQLLAVRGVTHAYAETVATDPAAPTPGDENRFPDQRYLRPAPDGVGAEWAWQRLGGGGELVRFVDVEQGWDLQHPDIAGWTTAPLTGQNRAGSWDHGTAVLDIVVGLDNGSGAIGLAPSLASVAVCSHFDGTFNANGEAVLNVADAIAGAVSALVGDGGRAPGDVLLVEVERPANGLMPAETDDADFAAIALATAVDVVVVEAAGNGSRDLGAWSSPTGRRLTRTPAEDSRAIVVASCNRQVESETVRGATVRGHRRNINKSSNYGARADCYAWGDGVVAADGTGGYQDDFAGTSSAAAIIAGVAVVVQGMHRAAKGVPLTAREMRDLLSGAGGTPQVPTASQRLFRIGVMPDLQVIGGTLGAARLPAPLVRHRAAAAHRPTYARHRS